MFMLILCLCLLASALFCFFDCTDTEFITLIISILSSFRRSENLHCHLQFPHTNHWCIHFPIYLIYSKILYGLLIVSVFFYVDTIRLQFSISLGGHTILILYFILTLYFRVSSALAKLFSVSLVRFGAELQILCKYPQTIKLPSCVTEVVLLKCSVWFLAFTPEDGIIETLTSTPKKKKNSHHKHTMDNRLTLKLDFHTGHLNRAYFHYAY